MKSRLSVDRVLLSKVAVADEFAAIVPRAQGPVRASVFSRWRCANRLCLASHRHRGSYPLLPERKTGRNSQPLYFPNCLPSWCRDTRGALAPCSGLLPARPACRLSGVHDVSLITLVIRVRQALGGKLC